MCIFIIFKIIYLFPKYKGIYLLSGEEMMFLSVVMRYKLPNSGCMSKQSLLQSLMGGTDVTMGLKSSMKLSWEK